MRSDPIQFAVANERQNREPRFVVRIEFDTASPHITSHDDIVGVPGDVMNGLLKRPSAISQRIIPDEGRSEIGSFTFTLVDKNQEFTAAMRDQLTNQRAGLRRRKVEFYVGYKGMAFSDMQLFQTQIVSRCNYRAGIYEVRCSDITRELRKEVFRPVNTTLRDSVSDSATTIPVYDTSAFHMVAHGSAYSDAPNATVGYIRIEDEIIRYTAQTLDYFAGCTRGALNTKAVAHAVDVGTAAERRTKVEEFIYLEGPGPQIALAVLTGSLYGTGNSLPAHWNLGIPASYVRTADFVAIGLDLWDPADDTASLIFRWDGLKQQDGKRFVEKEIYLLLGCYSPVYSDGAMGLRRMTGVISDASPVVTLTERELISLSSLEHEFQLLHNDFRIDWAWNPIAEGYERTTGFFDLDSIDRHGEAPLLSYEFKGLHSQRATDSTIAIRLDSIRDRYSEPPLTITATTFGSLNRIEVGDIAGIRVSPDVLRDFAGPAGDYNRSHEVQQKTYDPVSGDQTLSLFASTARPESLPSTPDTTARALPDAWYTSAGANLNTVIPIAGNLAVAGTYTLTGSSSVTASAAVFYWDGDLTIPNGCNITIDENVQLRIRGFLTLNGTINGVGNGLPGAADAGASPWGTTYAGNPGYVGHSRGWDGIKAVAEVPRTAHIRSATIPAIFTRGIYDAFPLLTLQVVSGELVGLPNDLRGGGGGPGGRIVGFGNSEPVTIVANGGTGGNGGAGLAIICRGMSFGVSASITLNGDSTTSGSLVSIDDVDVYAGAGGPGAPGALLILLDGNNISIPVITGKVIATTGGMTQAGYPMRAREDILRSIPFAVHPELSGPPHCGYADPGIAGALTIDGAVPNVVVAPRDLSNAAHRIQYIPIPLDANPDEDARPPAPSQLAAGPGNGGNILTWFNPDLDTFDVIEVWASLDNDRTNAVKVGETRSSDFTHRLPLGGLYYYWIRAKLNPVSGRTAVYSEWERESANDGESSNIETPGEIPEAPDDFTATGKANGIQFNWSLPWAKLSGKLQLYEYTSSTPFESAELVWEGYALGYFLPQSDTTTRYYWLVLAKGGALSVPEPPVTGLAAAASSATSALSVICSPDSIAKSAGVPPPNPKTITTDATTANATGGTGPYTYAWSFLSGGTGITINSPTAASTTFSGTNVFDGTTLWATVLVTVTDSLAATAENTMVVQMNWPSIG